LVQVLISLTTALILLSAIMFGQKWGLTFASALVFMQMAPNLFTPVQRLISSYTIYQSLVPGIVSTYELFDTKPTVVEKPGAVPLGEVHGESLSTMWSSATRLRRKSSTAFPLKSRKAKP